MMRKRRASGGFTLLELLVAMTVLGVLTALLAGGLRFGTRVWEREQNQLDQWAELEIVQDVIRRLVGQALLINDTAKTGAQSGAFVGLEDSIRFLGPPPAQSLVGGIYQYELFGRTDPDGQRLVLNWRLRLPEGEVPKARVTNAAPDEIEKMQAGRDVVLADHVASVAFSYFGTSDDGTAASWRGRWDDASKLPSLVRMTVTFPPGDRRSWPDLIVVPQITAVAGES
jgi:general secretion pathway protein J